MNLHRRGDSLALQTRIPVSNTAGDRSCLVRSLHTADVGQAAARSASLTALASGVHSDWLAVKRLVEDVFRAAGHDIPAIAEHALPERVMLWDFGLSFIKRKESRVSVSHAALCRRAITSFCRAHRALSLSEVLGHHLQTWVDGLSARLAWGTVFNWFTAVSGMLQFAVSMGRIRGVNPCESVDIQPERGERGVVHREPMPEADFEKVLARVAGSEWETAALFGRFAGLRIADSVAVSGEAVEFTDGACLLAVRPGKTKRCEVLPLFGPIVGHLRGICRPGPLTPGLASLSVDRLSKAFCRLCDEAGVDSRSIELGNGRTARRVSFHSLRHGFVTDLSRRGVPVELRKKLSAHASDSAHAHYDHASALDLHRQVATFFPDSHV